MQIPPDHLHPDTLLALIEEFVTRHGADGNEQVPIDLRIDQVRRQLLSGRAAITFDEATDTCTIISVEPRSSATE